MPLADLRRPLLRALLALESGIDPRLHEFYRRNYGERVMRAPVVERPGRGRRDPQTGALVLEAMTVHEYFVSLGVADEFDAKNPDCLFIMQYRSMNALGFIGYQFGEWALIGLGAYAPRRVTIEENGTRREMRSYYAGEVPTSFWTGGRREGLHPAESEVWVTDVNTWQGRFTGVHGATNFESLRSEAVQERLVRAFMRANLETITRAFEGDAASFREALRTRNTDASGILAAAHLCGAPAAIRYLRGGASAVDELGTKLETYASRFAEHELPFEEP